MIKINVWISIVKKNYEGPFRFVWQNIFINTVRFAMVCKVYFSFSKIV